MNCYRGLLVTAHCHSALAVLQVCAMWVIRATRELLTQTHSNGLYIPVLCLHKALMNIRNPTTYYVYIRYTPSEISNVSHTIYIGSQFETVFGRFCSIQLPSSGISFHSFHDHSWWWYARTKRLWLLQVCKLHHMQHDVLDQIKCVCTCASLCPFYRNINSIANVERKFEKLCFNSRLVQVEQWIVFVDW